MPVDVLILAAFDPELAPLRALLGEQLTARVLERTVVARTAGIGVPASAAGAAARIAEFEPRAVVLIGSCGAYATAGLAIGEVVVARRLRLVDPSGLGGLGGATQFPAPMAIDMETDAGLRESLAASALPGLPRARRAHLAACVATTLGITVDDSLAARIAGEASADVEHLEAHGVATACAMRSRPVPFAAVLGVANVVGRRGRAEWLAHHGDAEAAAGGHVVRWLRAAAASRLG